MFSSPGWTRFLLRDESPWGRTQLGVSLWGWVLAVLLDMSYSDPNLLETCAAGGGTTTPSPTVSILPNTPLELPESGSETQWFSRFPNALETLDPGALQSWAFKITRP